MEMRITVGVTGHIWFTVTYRDQWAVQYGFADWHHFLGHFGNMLPLTSCPFRITP